MGFRVLICLKNKIFHPFFRAQSVRRTSLRDKTLTTKKDAVEETRLRLQAQEVSLLFCVLIRRLFFRVQR